MDDRKFYTKEGREMMGTELWFHLKDEKDNLRAQIELWTAELQDSRDGVRRAERELERLNLQLAELEAINV